MQTLFCWSAVFVCKLIDLEPRIRHRSGAFDWKVRSIRRLWNLIDWTVLSGALWCGLLVTIPFSVETVLLRSCCTRFVEILTLRKLRYCTCIEQKFWWRHNLPISNFGKLEVGSPFPWNSRYRSWVWSSSCISAASWENLFLAYHIYFAIKQHISLSKMTPNIQISLMSVMKAGPRSAIGRAPDS